MSFCRLIGYLNARSLRRDTRGVAAVEFAVIVPLVLMLFFGTIEVSTGVAVDRKVVILTRTLSDLISQAQTVVKADITNAFNISSAVMTPYSSTPVQAIISQIYIDPKTLTPKLVWSEGFNQVAHSCGDTVAVPSGLAIPGTYLIKSEVKYDYTPVAGIDGGGAFKPPTFHLGDATFTRPRQTDSVTYNDSSGKLIACP